MRNIVGLTAALGLAGVLAGCASKAPAAPAAAPGGPSWKLEGTRVIACCCAAPCS